MPTTVTNAASDKLMGFYKNATEDLQKKLNSIDKKDTNNLATCAEYAEGIFAYLRNKEESMYAKDGFLKNQTEVTDKIRAGVIEWMVDTQLRFKLEDETLFLAINILDRFLEKEKVLRLRLPLLSATAVLIAAKYEEIYPPHLKDIMCVAEKPLNRDEIMKMEIQILQTLKFDISIPTVLRFLQRYSKLLQSDENERLTAQYICEFQLLDSKMAKNSPSLLATSGLYLARKIAKKTIKLTELPWTEAKHSEAEIQACAKEMVSNMMIKEKVALSNIRRKYGKYREVTKTNFEQVLI